jgi:hypothetical protein
VQYQWQAVALCQFQLELEDHTLGFQVFIVPDPLRHISEEIEAAFADG